MSDFNANLWAPWRMAYIRSLEEELKEDGCFLCKYWAEPENDAVHHVVWRGASAFVVMNRFPYTNGHLLVSVAAHKADLTDLTSAELAETGEMIRTAVTLLRKLFKPDGFNVGYNLGRCAGAGLPDHVHAHVVPRWAGDTNYMTVLGDVRVLPDALDASYAQLVEEAQVAGLRA